MVELILARGLNILECFSAQHVAMLHSLMEYVRI